MSKNREIKIEYECPEECHICPIGRYIQNNFFQISPKNLEYDIAICNFCNKDDEK